MKHRGFIAAVLIAGTALGAGDALAQGPSSAMTFESLDRDGDGAISRAEMTDRQAVRFARADADGDGMLSRDEMIAAATRRAADRVTAMLDRLDTDGDGALSLAESRQRGAGRAERMFERADKDDDGRLSRAEFDAVKARMGKRKSPRHGQN